MARMSPHPPPHDTPLAVLPELPGFAAWRAQRLATFRQRWRAVPSLRRLDALDRDDVFATWSALCYVEYEALYSLCAEKEDFCRLATLALGECLVQYLGMRWCRSPLFPGENMLLHHPDYPSRVRNLYALVVHRWLAHGSYELPQLFDDMLQEWYSVLPYPLDAVSHLPWRQAQPLYLTRWGSAPAETLHQRLYRVFHTDAGTAVRFISDTAFRLPGNPPWKALEYAIRACEAHFDAQANDCPPDWRARAEAAYAGKQA